jgi:heme/copper-type cytochrome/quinol oxidase subunit 2
MKRLLTAIVVLCLSIAYGQTVPAPQPIEERYHVSYWWWILGVILAIAAGIGIYMLIKKDPKRDVVR